jgi:sialate O-acetylesterase
MTMFKSFVVLFYFLHLSAVSTATITLPVIFQDNMVLQRDKVLTIWGFGDAGEKLTLKLKGTAYKTVTNPAGNWLLTLPPQLAGGPHIISIQGSMNKVELNNVLFGDVWICGGQSNMQFSLSQIGHKFPAHAATSEQNLRIFTASIDMDYVPKKDLAGGTWLEANPQTLSGFSATAYFFGRSLADSLNIPIGLISDNLGATSVESWMSAKALSPFPQFAPFCNKYLQPAKSFKEVTAAFEKIKPGWEATHYLGGEGLRNKWYLPTTDVTNWKAMEIPAWWEDKGLADFDGAVWFRKTFDLPPNFKGTVFPLHLNQIDDYDIVWVNGTKIGEGFGNINWRNYNIPAGILKPVGNTIVVRIFDAGGKGGMYSSAIWGNPILLGKWLYKPDVKIDATKFPKPHVVNVSPFSTPAILYNGNIAPITPLAIKGFTWYQGENNTSRAHEYRQLFPAFIQDWRNQFKQGNLPFLFVQLANYMEEATTPRESEWAELRDAQAAALALPNTGMAVAIEIGEAGDIHPKNKSAVGKRLSLEALRVAYGKEIISAGPTYDSMSVHNDSVVIFYKKNTNQLVTKNKYGYVSGFALAGSDRKFYWATATIRNNTVVVWSKNVKNPVAVRYAWSDNPGPLDLYNEGGLPAAPFRTDNFPYKTTGKLFSENPWEF